LKDRFLEISSALFGCIGHGLASGLLGVIELLSSLFKILVGRKIPQYFHRLKCDKNASILMYHAIVDQELPVADWCFLPTAAFRRQLLYLKQNFDVIPLGKIPRWRWRGKPAAVLTFDDGFENNYRVAFPILRELGLPATIFLVTDLIGSEDTVWFCRVNEAIARTQRKSIQLNGRTYKLGSNADRRDAGAAIQAWLKRFPHEELLSGMRAIVQTLGEDPDKPIPAGSPFRMLAPAQIREMANSGLIEFGAHTASHAILRLLPEAARTHEIENSIRAVQRLADRPCRLFSYPNGRAGDFDAFDTAVLKAAGIQVAVSTIEGPNPAGSDHLSLHRYGIGADNSFTTFRMRVHHMDYHLLKCLGR